MSRVLCVDDETSELEQIASELRQRGCTVEKARTPSAALSSVYKNPYGYEVILTDLDFGRTDEHNGIWLVQQVLDFREQRGYGPAPEIIALTGKLIDPDVLNRLQSLGARYVLKG